MSLTTAYDVLCTPLEVAMIMDHRPKRKLEEHARMGKEIYEQRIRPLVDPSELGRIVAIDVESGDYELADDTLSATERLYARRPDAQPWIVRIGHAGVHRFGPRSNIVERLTMIDSAVPSQMAQGA